MGKIYINNDWYYSPNFNKETINKTINEELMEKVRLPHTNIEVPYNCFDEGIYQFVSTYKKQVYVAPSWKGKRVLLTFEGIAHIAKVYMCGKIIGEHYGGYTAFTIDISSYLEFGQENTIVVEVDSRESNNIPPFGFVIDYMTYGGIYREVYLEIKEKQYIENVFVKSIDVCEENKTLKADVTLNNVTENLSLRYYIKPSEESDESYKYLGTLEVTNKELEISKLINDVDLWEIDNPKLYHLKIELINEDKVIDTNVTRFGFRQCQFKKDGFYLNNKKIKIMGLNRHQAYPYVGYAMPKRAQQNDADILKYELGLNAVRTSHYPQSHHFIDRCDEIGLLVFTEIPGWQHIGDEQWKEVAIENTREMVLQYRNHPSIILWGVRINESKDDDEFYKKTNEAAHILDDTRQTGGVRFIKKSNLLEDVYTYNDFSHNGNSKGLDLKKSVTSKIEAPYMVSEYNGHMFPTKAFDSESHRLEHARRHMMVLESLFGNDDIVGGFGWCMFDYNTHKDFGSGDRICYHGVLNMFRGHKLASSVYSSQSNNKDVLTISSNMNIGEHSGGYIGDVIAFTNAECVKLYKNKDYIKTFYPDKLTYVHMPHPPIIINDFVGELIEKNENIPHKSSEIIKEGLFAVAKYGQSNLPIKHLLRMGGVMLKEKLKFDDYARLYGIYIANWGGEAVQYRFEAIKNNEVVNVVTKETLKKVYLRVVSDTNELIDGDTYDVACVRVEVVDQHGEVVPYYQGVINFSIEGEVDIIGPKSIAIIGGSSGTYIKTIGRRGIGKLTVSGYGLDSVYLEFKVGL